MPSQEDYLDNLLKGIGNTEEEENSRKESEEGVKDETLQDPQIDMSDMDDLLQSALEAQQRDIPETQQSQNTQNSETIHPEETSSMSEDEIDRLLQQSREQAGSTEQQKEPDTNENDDLIKMLENVDDESLSNVLDQMAPNTENAEEPEKEEKRGKRKSFFDRFKKKKAKNSKNSAADETELMARAEQYPADADLPGEPGQGPLILTCGVDCQHKYMQYEIVGWARYGESWGIRTGYIPGAPDDDKTWEQLDSIISRVYKFQNGRGLRVMLTFIDSGDGNFTNEIAKRCKRRQQANVFAVKGNGQPGRPFITPPNRVPISENKRNTYILYNIGVNAGKSAIMNAVQVQEPGPNYMHFPGEDRGYDLNFFAGLLSEVEVAVGNVMKWQKLPGHERNEALDIRNYARAAVKVINPDFDAWERALRTDPVKKARVSLPRRPRRPSLRDQLFD